MREVVPLAELKREREPERVSLKRDLHSSEDPDDGKRSVEEAVSDETPASKRGRVDNPDPGVS
jgi:hypothetical protein